MFEHTATGSGWLAAVGVVAAVLCAACDESARVESTWVVEGRKVEVWVDATSAAAAGAIAKEMEEVTRRVARLVDPADRGSELHELNARAVLEPYPVRDRDLYIGIKHALDYAQASQGAFDPTAAPLFRLYQRAAAEERLPSEAEIERALEQVGWDRVTLYPESHAVRLGGSGTALDLREAGQGLGLDIAARAFSRAGSRGGLLATDGCLLAWGKPIDAEHWLVELPDPREAGAVLGRMSVDNRGVGVSGLPPTAPDGRPLVLDPRTGKPTESDVLVAVATAEGAADARALAEALRIGGSLRAGTLLGKTNRVEALLLVDPGGTPYAVASASLRDRLELSDAVVAEVGGRVRYILPPETIDLPAVGF